MLHHTWLGSTVSERKRLGNTGIRRDVVCLRLGEGEDVGSELNEAVLQQLGQEVVESGLIHVEPTGDTISVAAKDE